MHGIGLCFSAHPRVCGENVDRGTPCRLQGGSSPRVRGKRGCANASQRLLGLIPACAGKTTPGWGQGRAPGAHPRVCGENLMLLNGVVIGSGSSPRVRGKRPRELVDFSPRGLIPACAGKTLRRPQFHPTREAHPRVCGENSTRLSVSGPHTGSSPRVRGKRRTAKIPDFRWRLIPACAGKTRTKTS